MTAPADAAVPAVAPQTEGAAPDDRALRALFDRARDGDGAALDALCRAMRPRLFRVALAVLRDADDADDVAQEALVRAVTRRLLFLGTGSVGGWMTRIALNLAKNRRRDGRRRAAIVAQAPPSDLGARGAVASAPPRPDERLLDDEQRRRLRAALPTLPERQRDVMQLRAVAGLDFAAVAATLEITEANARMTFSLAKKKLQALVADPVDAAAPATAAPATAAPSAPMTTPDDDLPALRDDAAPRRTDAAFARAVAADVARRRGGLRALVPLLAPLSVGCAIFAFVFSRSPNAPSSLVPRPPPAAVVVAADVEGRAAAFDRDAIDAEVDDDLDAVGGDAVADAFDLDDVALLAFAGPAAADPAGFAFDGLEGSSDRELDDIERAFDAALAQKL